MVRTQNSLKIYVQLAPCPQQANYLKKSFWKWSKRSFKKEVCLTQASLISVHVTAWNCNVWGQQITWPSFSTIICLPLWCSWKLTKPLMSRGTLACSIIKLEFLISWSSSLAPQTHGVHLALCADGICLYVTDHKEGFVRTIQHGLGSLKTWCECWNIKSNEDKTQGDLLFLQLLTTWVPSYLEWMKHSTCK
jgi:hypothetical protein